jgi:DNA-binding NtrC family response regulator
LIVDGLFREDLFYRLNVVPVTLPPLRQRSSDIPLLVAHFLEKSNAGSKSLSAEALKALTMYQWPGNIRELENTIERIVILSKGDEIGVEDLPAEVRSGGSSEERATRGFTLPEEGADLEEVELDLITQALDRTGASTPKAAKLLGLTSKTLEARMKRLGL